MSKKQVTFNDANEILTYKIWFARQYADKREIKFIRSLWDGETWESILKKVDTEGSVWVVWWNDGVNALARHLNAKLERKTA